MIAYLRNAGFFYPPIFSPSQTRQQASPPIIVDYEIVNWLTITYPDNSTALEDADISYREVPCVVFYCDSEPVSAPQSPRVNRSGTGSKNKPFKSLLQAVAHARAFREHFGEIRVKIYVNGVSNVPMGGDSYTMDLSGIMLDMTNCQVADGLKFNVQGGYFVGLRCLPSGFANSNYGNPPLTIFDNCYLDFGKLTSWAMQLNGSLIANQSTFIGYDLYLNARDSSDFSFVINSDIILNRGGDQIFEKWTALSAGVIKNSTITIDPLAESASLRKGKLVNCTVFGSFDSMPS